MRHLFKGDIAVLVAGGPFCPFIMQNIITLLTAEKKAGM